MLFLFVSFVNYAPQVECFLFPDIQNLYLRTISPDESLVTNFIDKAKDLLHKNTVGPTK